MTLAGKPTLRHVENRIFPHHRHKTLGFVFAFALRHAELLDKVDFGSVFAFAHTPASLLRLLERDEARRWPASIVRLPYQIACSTPNKITMLRECARWGGPPPGARPPACSATRCNDLREAATLPVARGPARLALARCWLDRATAVEAAGL
jgi:hypothetical protein